nr:hypothetical protein [Tanacetum cinerariifolium]
MYKEYLAEFWYSTKALKNSKVSFSMPTGGIYGEVGVNTFRNAIGAHYLPHSSEYVAPPSIDIVRPWFETTGYGETVHVKGTLKKSLLLHVEIINGTYYPVFRRYGKLTLYHTQVFSINNWSLKPNQTKEPLFTYHMLAIRSAIEPVVFKALKSSSSAVRVPQGIKLGVKPGHKKHLTSLKQPFVSSKEVTKGGSSKTPTSSKPSHSKKRKEFSSAIDSNPSQPSVSTPVDTGMYKEDQQATGGLTSLEVTIEARANPQLSSDMSALNLNKTIYSVSFIIHSEFASGNDASVVSKAGADLGNSPLNLDSPEDDPIIVVDDSDEDEEDEVHATTNIETEDTLVSKSSSPMSSQIQELTNQVLVL